MGDLWVYSLLSVLVVSLVSFIGVIGLSFKVEKLRMILIYLISFSAGALFGDVFFHLLPGLEKDVGFSFNISAGILGGILMFFVLEKIVHWQHCHMPQDKGHVHSFAYMNLVGDGLHNFIDGMIIATSYMVSIPVGFATTIAVVLHEIPQEIGDFGVLIHGGFSKGKALMLNFLSACFAIVGAIFALWLTGMIDGVINIVVPIAIGGFLYIAGSDLIPELHKEIRISRSILQVISFILGIAIMALLLLLE